MPPIANQSRREPTSLKPLHRLLAPLQTVSAVERFAASQQPPLDQRRILSREDGTLELLVGRASSDLTFSFRLPTVAPDAPVLGISIWDETPSPRHFRGE